MRIGLNLFSLRNLIQTEEEFLSAARTLKAAGYTYFQYSGAAFDPERIKRVSEETGMPVTLTHVPLDRILNDTEKLMEEHAVFGCKNIGLGMLPNAIVRDEAAVKAKIDELNRAAEKMAQNGFRFFYHNHHNEFTRHGGQTVFEYMLLNAPYVNFTLDTYWVQYGGVNLYALLDRLHGRIGCVHLKDYKIVPYEEDGDPRFKPAFAPLGEGNLDLKTVVTKMKEAGTEYFFVEQDDAADLPDGLEQVIRSAKYACEEL